MAAYGVTATDVNQIGAITIFLLPARSRPFIRASVDAETDVKDPDGFGNIVVKQMDDKRVRLADVADIELASSNYDSAVYSSGQETIFIAITEAPGANPLEMADRVKAKLEEIRPDLPADLEIFMDSDLTIYISEALERVAITLIEATIIVILVILLFLGSLRVVTIPIIAIPLSLISVLFLIWVMGFSINLLTLLAMVIAIGLVVDDAIVVTENVHRHIENGDPPFHAAIKGAREVSLPVMAMTLTLVAVYLPIGFLGGLTGIPSVSSL